MADEKYVVVRRTEWDAWTRRQANNPDIASESDLPTPLPDAVVIRTHDVFATGGLYAYAHNIQTALETDISWKSVAATSKRAALETTRDYFFERAREAEAILRAGDAKLPD